MRAGKGGAPSHAVPTPGAEEQQLLSVLGSAY